MRAAVAVVVVDANGESAVPIFQRTAGMRRHAGQMALPGGRANDQESAEACAMRELHEELGLQVTEEDVIGHLDDFETRSGFAITPVVFWSGAPASSLEPSPSEVARLVVVRVRELQRAAARAGEGEDFSLRLPTVTVFAPTAAILYQFSEVALGGRDVRVADFFQPPFTHR
jgi:8-oxo-dGTP pyrophosphatase MutT (NUDIX family)